MLQEGFRIFPSVTGWQVCSGPLTSGLAPSLASSGDSSSTVMGSEFRRPQVTGTRNFHAFYWCTFRPPSSVAILNSYTFIKGFFLCCRPWIQYRSERNYSSGSKSLWITSQATFLILCLHWPSHPGPQWRWGVPHCSVWRGGSWGGQCPRHFTHRRQWLLNLGTHIFWPLKADSAVCRIPPWRKVV